MQEYRFSSTVRRDDALRASFNALTRNTFGFDFTDWYSAGHWGELYIPHVLIDGEKVISNVSVNHMVFDQEGHRRHYLQLGTVMTDGVYRMQGLNRQIMEKILGDYAGQVDGIYLFGNDSVLEYYPKFGFRPAVETEYYLPRERFGQGYCVEPAQPEELYDAVKAVKSNPNDAMYMCENLGLYQFWCGAEFGENVYYIPEVHAYVLAVREGSTLYIHQIIGENKLDLARLAASFGADITEAVFGFTPADRHTLPSRPHKEEDCTLFLLGKDLDRIEADRLIFPTLSHA